MPTKLEVWRTWLEEDLSNEVHALVRRHEVFKSWNEILDIASPESKSNGLFHTWVVQNYAEALAVALRRVTDDDKRSRSLVRFLRDVESNTDVLTRDWWLSNWVLGDPPQHYIDQFDRLARGGDCLAVDVADQDRESVSTASARIKAWVDTHVAHVDRNRAIVAPPKFGDAHSAVSTVYGVFHKWYEWVVNVALSFPLEVHWEHVLSVPWISEEQAYEVFMRRFKEGQSTGSELRSWDTE